MTIQEAEKKHKVSKSHPCWKCGYSLEEHIKEANRFNNSPDFNFQPFKQKGDVGDGYRGKGK
jgi:hypothetical protein